MCDIRAKPPSLVTLSTAAQASLLPRAPFSGKLANLSPPHWPCAQDPGQVASSGWMGRQRPSLLHEEICLGQQGRFHLEKVGSSICQQFSPVSSRPCVQITTADHSPGKAHIPSLLCMTMARGCPQPPALDSVTSALLLEGHYCLSADFTTLLPHPSAFRLLHPRSVLSSQEGLTLLFRKQADTERAPSPPSQV